MTVLCGFCSVELPPSFHDIAYCSRKCHRLYYNAHFRRKKNVDTEILHGTGHDKFIEALRKAGINYGLYDVTFRGELPFYPAEDGTFLSTSGSSSVYALPSSAFSGPSGRCIRFVSMSSASIYVKLGSSAVTPSSTTGELVVGRLPVVQYITPAQAYIAIKSSTDVVLSVSLGYGR